MGAVESNNFAALILISSAVFLSSSDLIAFVNLVYDVSYVSYVLISFCICALDIICINLSYDCDKSCVVLIFRPILFKSVIHVSKLVRIELSLV